MSKSDFETRVKTFNADLTKLLEKYQIGVRALPGLTPDGRIGAQIAFFDDSEEARKEREQKPESELVKP